MSSSSSTQVYLPVPPSSSSSLRGVGVVGGGGHVWPNTLGEKKKNQKKKKHWVLLCTCMASFSSPVADDDDTQVSSTKSSGRCYLFPGAWHGMAWHGIASVPLQSGIKTRDWASISPVYKYICAQLQGKACLAMIRGPNRATIQNGLDAFCSPIAVQRRTYVH